MKGSTVPQILLERCEPKVEPGHCVAAVEHVADRRPARDLVFEVIDDAAVHVRQQHQREVADQAGGTQLTVQGAIGHLLCRAKAEN